MIIKLYNEKFEDYVFDDDVKISLSILDPPDNIGCKYKGYNDKLSIENYSDLLTKWTVKACKITNGPVFLSFNEKWIYEVEHILKKYNIPLIQRLYWFYTFGQNNKKRYTPSVRPIYWINKDTIYPENIKILSARQAKYGDKRAASGGRLPNNVWEYSRVCGTFKERRSHHPCQHPEKLIERIVLGHSKEGDTILDPFIGSGTTAIVCKRLNRNCVGIDISDFYVNKVIETLNANE